MEPATAHITLDIDLSTTPSEGSLSADGVSHRFAGYMQLVTVLEAALQAARSLRSVSISKTEG
jgi:hypothetical protein